MMRKLVACALALGMAMAAPAAMADPPPHAGGGKGKGGPPAHAGGGGKGKGGPPGHAGGRGKGGDAAVRYDTRGGSHHREVHRGGGGDVSVSVHFGDRDYVVVRDYYTDLGHCPPGLAKKNNGCMPPGQAKKWRVGHVLPPDVIYYDLPPELVVRLSPTSAGYKYVRVGADILKIAVGTGLIVDAIEDLGRL